MTTTRPSVTDERLHHEVERFYARQMQLLDSGAAREWAATFTEDGVFTANAHPEPQRGRAAIEAGALDAISRLEAQAVQRRHWLGMLTVDHGADGTFVARTYALVIETPEHGRAAVRLSCTCRDVLVRRDGALLVRHRQVHRDDLPAA
ncbi:nuclear transport factor 2 family protein [Amycolatopsis sp. NPDC049688]|uniref:nuclear transport factor 2 family protein n=1 Tax=Amycolatopsis sp. NPDC049688 TaxID=3154733 RepID=UPI003436C334